MSTKIEWCDETWNPITGCTPVSPGCDHCYAKRRANRLRGRYGYPQDAPFRPGTVHEDRLSLPLRWRKPRRIFVDSMGDLFHGEVMNRDRQAVIGIISMLWPHTFVVLTKRPLQMRYWFGHTTLATCQAEVVAARPQFMDRFMPASERRLREVTRRARRMHRAVQFPENLAINGAGQDHWPLPNLWLLVSAEDQKRLDERLPILLRCPAAVRGVSVEPCLGPVNLNAVPCWGPCSSACRDWHKGRQCNGAEQWICQTRAGQGGIGWVICGPETGPGARPMDLDWARSLRDQCKAAGVAFFYKGGKLDGKTHHEFPKVQGPHE